MKGESERLSRLINNVLNYTKIENGIKDYSFGNINLNDCIEEVLKIMEYQFMMDNFRIEKSPGLNVFINADKDAVKKL
ncbi:MAG: HAMP domain-containing histidine kinase [Ignavibacteria bacterium]|nr:HAMP domain-containing histidine kinase [Ignavibacteria bacterium]